MVRLKEARNGVSDDVEVLGVPACNTHGALQTDAYKELINKVAWALGSTYRTPYNNTRSPTRQLAAKIARHVLETQGYPGKIERVDPR